MIQIGAPSATIDSPVDHLMACHRRIEQRLETLVKAADHLENERPAALAAIRNALRFLDTSGVLHTEDEERSLFPRLRPRLTIEELAFVDTLETQHAQADAIYAELKRLVDVLTSEAGPAEIAGYRECAVQLQTLYRDHIRSEDEILTAMARRLLDDAAVADIAGEMRTRRGPGAVR